MEERKIITYNDLVREALKNPILVNGVWVPGVLSGGLTPLRVYPIDHIHTGKFGNHWRIKVFREKGIHCSYPGCDKQGTYVISTIDTGGGWHLDIFTRDFSMMTVDHIYPKSGGGTDALDNLQPMCDKHNVRKGSKVVLYDINTREPFLADI